MGSLNKMSDIQWEFQDPKMEVLYHISTVFCGDIPLHRPYIGLIYGRHLQFRFLKWPLRYLCMTLRCLLIGTHRLVQDDADQVPGEQLNFVRTNVAWTKNHFINATLIFSWFSHHRSSWSCLISIH